jgi:hypothetical protein
MSTVAIQQMADRVAQLLEERLSITGRDLAAKLRKAGGTLPRKVRDRAEFLAAAAATAANPKLLGQIDMGEVAEAYDICVRHLVAIDPARRRRTVRAEILGSIGFGVLVVLIAVLAYMGWRGYL